VRTVFINKTCKFFHSRLGRIEARYVFKLGRFGVGTLYSWDVLGLGAFCGFGCFGDETFYSWGILGFGTFCGWNVFRLGLFVFGHFVGALGKQLNL
jgi:hypothetical protein